MILMFCVTYQWFLAKIFTYRTPRNKEGVRFLTTPRMSLDNEVQSPWSMSLDEEVQSSCFWGGGGGKITKLMHATFC